MYTQCTKCETYFRVTEDDLTAADGQVRCSQCDEVFDARARLLSPAQERALPHEGEDADPALLEPKIGDLFGADELDSEALDGERAPPSFSAGSFGLPNSPIGFELPAPFALASAGRPRGRTAPWLAACGGLALLLVLQLVHANREPLARDPQIGPTLVDAYQRLHLALKSPTDLSKLSIQRTDVTSHPVYHDVLYITATVTNDAAFAQPLPLLRVRLDDRWGEPVGIRIFRPEEYLRRTEPGARAEPGRAYGIALEVVDPGNEAVGYALTPCLPQGDTLVCLGDG